MPDATRSTRLGLTPATIETRDATPRAPAYDDVYFSAAGGLAESRHVFIDGNDLRRRFSAWAEQRPFVIGETGFGTGRNVLIAWQSFLDTAPAAARLHIVSFERHPLRRRDVETLWSHQPELAQFAGRLIGLWPAPVHGTHRLHLDERVTLDLILDDIEAGLAGFDGHIDAWFLDGFAPSRNPAMWSQRVFHELAAASRPAATFATYSCARVVRTHATAAGFVCHKRPGVGRKRDMLRGRLANTTPAIDGKRKQRPWFQPSSRASDGPIAIVGAGIAGASVAEALARRGQRCDVYDPCHGPGGASANALAALYIRPAANGDDRTRFYLSALAYTQRWLAGFDPRRKLWSDRGLLQLACNDGEAERQQQCIERLGLPQAVVRHVDNATAAAIAGISLSERLRGGLFYPQAGLVRPARLCEALLAGSGARLHGREVVALRQHDGGWRVTCDDGHTADYRHVVLACAHHAARLRPDLPPLIPARGQISIFACPATTAAPACVVCGHGQLMPAGSNQIHVGASFEPDSTDTAARAAEDRENASRLAAIAPALAAQLAPSVSSRVALRCSGHNRLPYVGPVPDTAAWRRDYAALALDARRIPDIAGTHRSGLWASLAHGASGMVSAPLAAEMLASRLLDEPAPLAGTLMDALHPGRWLIRQLQRGQ